MTFGSTLDTTRDENKKKRQQINSVGLQHCERQIAVGFYTPLESIQLKIVLK